MKKKPGGAPPLTAVELAEIALRSKDPDILHAAQVTLESKIAKLKNLWQNLHKLGKR